MPKGIPKDGIEREPDAYGKRGRKEPVLLTPYPDEPQTISIRDCIEQGLITCYRAWRYFQGHGIRSVSDANILTAVCTMQHDLVKHSKDDQLTHLSKVPADLKEQASRLK